jgi:16S rRNA (uracil1498-N3)-methyltransferase
VDSVTLLRTEYSQEPKNSDLEKVIRRCELKSLVSLKQSLKPWLTSIAGPVTLEDWLQNYSGDIILCDINGVSEVPSIATTTTLLVGPEGGFSEKEVAQIKAFRNGQVHLLKLGETRLRARTAAVVALGKLL